MKHAFASAALAAGLAWAGSAVALSPQTSTLISDTSLSVPSTFKLDGTTAYVGIAECERMVSNNSLIGVTFGTNVDTTATGLFQGARYFDVERDSSAQIDCETGELCREVDAEDVDQTSELIELEMDFQEFTQFTTTDACADVDREFFARIQIEEFDGADSLDLADARVIIDTVRPEPPIVTSVTATDSTIRVEFEPSPSPDLLRYRVIYSTEPLTEGTIPDDLNASGVTFGSENVTSGDVDVMLEAGQNVFVAVVAQDETGNFSPLSSVTEATTLETTDFWEAYKQANGAETGGCSQSPTTPEPGHLLLLALAGLGIVIRRRTNR